jgi:Flp pilus assembly protein TadG
VLSRSPARGGETGTVTAEFATVVPAVLLVLACCLGGTQLAAQQLRLAAAASDAARVLARGEDTAAAGRLVARLVPGAVVRRHDRGALACVQLAQSATAAGGLLGAVTVTASSCALAGEP